MIIADRNNLSAINYYLGSIILIGVVNHLNQFFCKKIMHLFKIPDKINSLKKNNKEVLISA